MTDPNVLLSIVLGHAASRAVQEGGVEIATTLETLREVREHLGTLSEKYKTRAGLVESRLEAPAVQSYGPKKYRATLAAAERRRGHRDSEDVDLLALALRLGVAIWTNEERPIEIGGFARLVD